MGDMIKKLEGEVGSRLNLDVAGFPPLTYLKDDATVYGCEAGRTLMTVEPNGVIKACGILPDNMGAQIDKGTLLDIWHSPSFVNMRRQPDCEDCNYTQICWGPCRFLEHENSPAQ